jgi:hypothetical protein
MLASATHHSDLSWSHSVAISVLSVHLINFIIIGRKSLSYFCDDSFWSDVIDVDISTVLLWINFDLLLFQNPYIGAIGRDTTAMTTTSTSAF